jgi:uncharacterized OB-fold protein
MAMEAATDRARPFLCGEALKVDADGRATLMGSRCGDCGVEFFPPAPVCSSCMSENMKAQAMPSRGTLYAFSTVHIAAKKWKLPMRIGYVDLKNRARVFTHLEGDDLKIGDEVEVAVGAVGEDAEGPITTFVFKKVAP